MLRVQSCRIMNMSTLHFCIYKEPVSLYSSICHQKWKILERIQQKWYTAVTWGTWNQRPSGKEIWFSLYIFVALFNSCTYFNHSDILKTLVKIGTLVIKNTAFYRKHCSWASSSCYPTTGTRSPGTTTDLISITSRRLSSYFSFHSETSLSLVMI